MLIVILKTILIVYSVTQATCCGNLTAIQQAVQLSVISIMMNLICPNLSVLIVITLANHAQDQVMNSVVHVA